MRALDLQRLDLFVLNRNELLFADLVPGDPCRRFDNSPVTESTSCCLRRCGLLVDAAESEMVPDSGTVGGLAKVILGSITRQFLLVCLRSIDLVGRPPASAECGRSVL